MQILSDWIRVGGSHVRPWLNGIWAHITDWVSELASSATLTQKILFVVAILCFIIGGICRVFEKQAKKSTRKQSTRRKRNPKKEPADECYEPPHREYRGYVPSGCRGCGGPYPDCRDSCNLFDD